MTLIYILAGIGVLFILYIIYAFVFFAMMVNDLTEEEAKELQNENP